MCIRDRYYGLKSLDSIITHSRMQEFNYPGEDGPVYTRYEGKGGVVLSSFLRRLLYSWQFKDLNILISGEIEVEELPAIWNEKMRNFLGVEPKNDREGCLQDIHSFKGAFGYFPTYTLGALAAAQIFQAACTAETEIKPNLSEGCFVPLMRWLRENIHSKGSSASTNEILTGASGSPIGTKAFKLHLQQQYIE